MGGTHHRRTERPQAHTDYLGALRPLLGRGAGLQLEAPGIYTFINPYTYLVHRHTDPTTVLAFDQVFVDGIALVWLLRWLGIARLERTSFDMTSLAPRVFEYAEQTGKSVYFVGTEPRLVGEAVRNIKACYRGLRVAGYRHGFFVDEGERTREQEFIATAVRPDIVIVGMGAPQQERFLVELRAGGWHGLGFTCGGFLEQAAQRLHYFPEVLDRWHLRWLYRITSDRRKLVRFLSWYPRFLGAFARDYLRHKAHR